MQTHAAGWRYLAEFFGTMMLSMVVIGSGIMGTDLSKDMGTVLLINTLSTIFALALLIKIIGPISGAHFNPAVSLTLALMRRFPVRELPLYFAAQTFGGITGALVANLMFEEPAFQISSNARDGAGLLLGEVIATTGLLLVIISLVIQKSGESVVWAVPLWIGSAYFFTSSTSFANPAITISRIFSDSFAGISPASVPSFLLGQGIAVVSVFLFIRVIKTNNTPNT